MRQLIYEWHKDCLHVCVSVIDIGNIQEPNPGSVSLYYCRLDTGPLGIVV